MGLVTWVIFGTIAIVIIVSIKLKSVKWLLKIFEDMGKGTK